jgi:asparagine synthase (glutamine-hydrolysing)
MTALAGLWHFDGRPDAADGCARILSSQQLYGPHAVAQWTSGDLALGRRLMRILPEDVFDRQPLMSRDGRYVIIADIRLDNRDELVDALRVPSPRRGLCDAAVLLAAIEQWEDAFVDHIVGDYAIAIWDTSRRRLLLARDPLGQRPLHYHRGKKFLAFASMPKGLHALPEIPCAPDDDRVAQSLVLMPETGSQSFFSGIERVEPGHMLVVSTTESCSRNYWQPQRRKIAMPGPSEYAEAYRELLDQAVRCRLRGAEDAVGSNLSGGLDSGAVTATAARLLAASGGRVVAFTSVPRAGYVDDPPRNRLFDEGPYAAATAALYRNVEHVLIRSEGRSPLDGLDRGFLLFNWPCYNLCNSVWGDSINDAARDRKLKVVLNGDVGNFGLSYDGIELLPELLRAGRWFRLGREARALVKSGRFRWRGVLANTFGPWCPSALWVWLNKMVFGGDWDVSSYTAIHPQRFVELSLRDRARKTNYDFFERPWKDSFSMRVWALRRGDPGNYNKGVLAAWHVDRRDPTADVRFLEFCLAIPTEQFLSNGIPKALARRALADRLPKVVLANTQIGVQAADWHERLTVVRGDIAKEVERIAACPLAAKTLDLKRLRQMVSDWPTDGCWHLSEVTFAYRHTLLRAIAAGHFLRRATGTNG